MKSPQGIAAVSVFLLSQLAIATAFAAEARSDLRRADKVAAASTATAVDAVSATDGEVRKVDKDAKKITLKHGEIKNLDMPAMSMVFQVKDAALLEKVKAGDKVKFKAEKINGGYALTEIEVAK
jgi:Cu(I)/Ag(I) efflux system periplasmic protein CusF